MNSQDLEKKYHHFIVTLNKCLYTKQIDKALEIMNNQDKEIKINNCFNYGLKDPSFYLGSLLCENQSNIALINQYEPTLINLIKGSIYYKNFNAFTQLIEFYQEKLLEDERVYQEIMNYLNYKMNNDEILAYQKILKENKLFTKINVNLDFWNALLNKNYTLANEILNLNSEINYNFQNMTKYDNHLFHQIAYAWPESDDNIEDFKKICSYFINQPFNANLYDSWDNTPLNSMVRKNKFIFAKIYLQTLYPKEQINLKNKSGKTILHSVFYDKSVPYYLTKEITQQTSHPIYANAMDFITEAIHLGADLDLPSGLHNRGKSINKILKDHDEILIYFEKCKLNNAIMRDEKAIPTNKIKTGKI